MKSRFRHKFLLGLMLFTAVFSVVPPRAYAVAGTVYFTPGSGSVINGTEFDVEVRGNVPKPGGFWGGGTTTIVSYDASKLQVVNYNDTDGVFSSGGKNWNGTTSGTVKYTSQIFFNAPGVNNQKIISIKFKAVATGATDLKFASGTSVNDGPTTGTSSTFTILAPTCPAGQIGTPPNCSTPPPPAPAPTPTKRPTTPTRTPTPVATPAPAPTPTIEEIFDPIVSSDGGLKVENVRVTANRSENSVSWSLNNDIASSTVLYGTNKNNLKEAEGITRLDDGSYKLAFTDLKLGTLYYFTVKASTDDNLLGASYSGVLTTRGYPVQLTVKQNNVLLEGASVVIGGRTFKTNSNGIVAAELSDGKFSAAITPAGATTSSKADFTVKKIAVSANSNPETQNFTLDIHTTSEEPVSDSGSLLPLIVGGTLGLLSLAGAFFGFVIIKRKRDEQQQTHQTTDIDTMQLQQAYGRDVRNLMTNTPEPNLEGGFAAANYPVSEQPYNPAPDAITQQPAVAPPLPPEIAADSAEYAPQASVDEQPLLQQDPNSQPLQQYQYDPAAVPQPPAEIAPAPMPEIQALTPAPQLEATPEPQPAQQQIAPTAQPAQPEQPEIEDPALSQEVTRVEASEQPAPVPAAESDNEPSAIYDAATGELAIIHRRNTQGGQA